jgi:hypothetical protein
MILSFFFFYVELYKDGFNAAKGLEKTGIFLYVGMM